jgi:IS4 transposase
MNRHLEQLCVEILSLYRQQLNALNKIAKLDDIDLRQYDRRRERIEELRKELESHSQAA